VSPDTKISALDAGAEDYLTTPFIMGELLARLRAVLRRVQSNPAPAQPQPARHLLTEPGMGYRYQPGPGLLP
jgi:DNA-binding response OmpR family regulator